MPEPQAILRSGLLDGLAVLAAPRTALTDACAALGATVSALETDLLDEAATAAAAPAADVLVVDTAPLFGAGGPDALRAALDGAWSAVHAHFDASRATKVVLVAPRPEAGPYAAALGDALENLARTLSVEWARHGIRPTAILPGAGASDAGVAQLVAFVCSRAGDYLSGTPLVAGRATG